MYRHGWSCLRCEFDSEQIESALLQSGGSCQLLKRYGAVADAFDLHGICGEGSQICEQGSKAVNGEIILGHLGFGFSFGSL